MTFRTFFYKVRGRVASLLVDILPDDTYLEWKFAAMMGYRLDLQNPQTFCEKINWLKLHDVKPEFTVMVDKVEAKRYVAAIIGEEHIIPTIAVWDTVEDIDWEALPDKFVIKCSHDSGGVFICKDKKSFDVETVKLRLRKALKQNFTKYNKEYPYKNVKPRIIAEQYMVNHTADGKPDCKDLTDYKFYCYDGEPRYCQVIKDRNTEETVSFYDMDWQLQPFVGLQVGVTKGEVAMEKPDSLEEMKEICRKLSVGQRFLRVDLYEVAKRSYFGELTFYPNSGFGTFKPQEWNERLGKLLVLPPPPTIHHIDYYRITIDSEGIHTEQLEKKPTEILDYKFFCFEGRVNFFKIDFDRFTNHHANYYDRDCNLLPFGEAAYMPIPNRSLDIPENIQVMTGMAEQVAQTIDTPFVRVDFYNINKLIYFGEITFYPFSGFGKLVPAEWEQKVGDMIHLPV